MLERGKCCRFSQELAALDLLLGHSMIGIDERLVQSQYFALGNKEMIIDQQVYLECVQEIQWWRNLGSWEEQVCSPLDLNFSSFCQWERNIVGWVLDKSLIIHCSSCTFAVRTCKSCSSPWKWWVWQIWLHPHLTWLHVVLVGFVPYSCSREFEDKCCAVTLNFEEK